MGAYGSPELYPYGVGREEKHKTFCSNCGHEFEGNFCPNCGHKAEPVGLNFDYEEEKYDPYEPKRRTQNKQIKKEVKNKKSDNATLLGIIAIVIPLIGLIIWLCMRKKNATKAKSILICALVGLVLDFAGYFYRQIASNDKHNVNEYTKNHIIVSDESTNEEYFTDVFRIIVMDSNNTQEYNKWLRDAKENGYIDDEVIGSLNNYKNEANNIYSEAINITIPLADDEIADFHAELIEYLSIKRESLIYQLKGLQDNDFEAATKSAELSTQASQLNITVNSHFIDLVDKNGIVIKGLKR